MANDELAIRQLVKQLEAAWNVGDSVGIAAPFVDDADFVNIMGEYYKGRAPIEAGHRQIFDTIHKGSQVSFAVERVRFVHPDMAIAFLRAHLKFQAGDVRREGRARPTMVLAKHNEKWQIVAFQFTRIAEEHTPEAAPSQSFTQTNKRTVGTADWKGKP